MIKKSTSNHDTLIILPTLGQREDYLNKTIDSIMSQTYRNFDIAIIYPLDNQVVTTIANRISAIKVKDPGGLSAALNAGLAAAKPHHKFISWIGDDDLLTPESLESTVSALSRNPTAPVAYGYCDYINKDGAFLFKSRAGSLAPWIMTWGPDLLPLPGALFRKAAILEVGGFDETKKYSMDLDMFLRLKRLGKFINTKNTLAAFRWHSDSLSVSGRDISIKEAEAVKLKYTHPILKPFTFLWFIPTRYASKLAAKKLSKH